MALRRKHRTPEELRAEIARVRDALGLRGRKVAGRWRIVGLEAVADHLDRGP